MWKYKFMKHYWEQSGFCQIIVYLQTQNYKSLDGDV